jgi:hypothetical protein
MPDIFAQAVPTGGAIAINVSGVPSGVSTLQRAASGIGATSGYSQIYSGPVLAFYVDVGDGTPGPLNPAWSFSYLYTDSLGSGATPYIQPIATLLLQSDATTQILVRLIQGAMNSLVVPLGFPRPQVTQAMPMGGSLPMPLIVVNVDLLQMAEVPIGQSVTPIDPISNQQIITQFAHRTYRVSLLTQNVEQRDFYKEALIGIFEALYQTVLQPLGLDTTHKWQATAGQIAYDPKAMAPGFFYAEVMLDFTGTLNTIISPEVGLIEHFLFTATLDQQGTTQVVHVPPS